MSHLGYGEVGPSGNGHGLVRSPRMFRSPSAGVSPPVTPRGGSLRDRVDQLTDDQVRTAQGGARWAPARSLRCGVRSTRTIS